MSEDNAQNHANFADAFIMTGRAIKIDKRLPYFIWLLPFLQKLWHRRSECRENVLVPANGCRRRQYNRL